MSKIMWQPSLEDISNSNISQFISYVNNEFELNISSYSDLYEWSITEIEIFWKSLLRFSGIIYYGNDSEVLENRKMPGAKWFSDLKLNFAENILRNSSGNIAIVSARENRKNFELTFYQLNSLSCSFSNSLLQSGVRAGDRIAAFSSNIPEAVIGMLGATSIGAIWTSCSPDFGVTGVVERFGQIEPKILLASEAYSYNGNIVNCLEKIKEIQTKIPSIKKVILLPLFCDFYEEEIRLNDIKLDENYQYFTDFIQNGKEYSEIKCTEYNHFPFDHPVYIMYSSGTTGKPKCIVHGAGGILLQHYKEHYLHTNLKSEDTISYYTTCGWMMWNWLVSAMQIGTTIHLYDGSPVYPSVKTLWREIEDEQISVFGTSPKYLQFCEKSGFHPNQEITLSSLKSILSTGSTLLDSQFEWVFNKVGNNIRLSSISGGTDLVSCFMLGCPITPVFQGEIQVRGLGMKVEVWNEAGESITGSAGELICSLPFPTMPLYFWDDESGEKYRSAYFDSFPGVWRHGDYIEITPTGGILVHGRSDATLNPGGVRIGSTEIYNIVEMLPEISDTLAIGQSYCGDVRIILFVKLKSTLVLYEGLVKKIKDTIRSHATPRHVPAKVIQVKEIPRTLSGKKVEIAVTRIMQGTPVDNLESLANPESLEDFYKIRELLLLE